MNLEGEIKNYWAKRSEGYSKVNQDELEGSQHKAWSEYIKDKLDKQFGNRKAEDIKILDVGTGPGFFSIILTEMGYTVTAVDLTEEMLSKAKSNAGALSEKITYMQMNAEELSFENESFDVIVTRNLMWNLPNPKKAYASWLRVIKKGGIILNFDANWYGYLYNDNKRMEYEADRQNVLDKGIEDHYTCTDIKTMEMLALEMPLSAMERPKWDVEVLREMMVENVIIEEDMGKKVWSDIEALNYASTPMFMVEVIK